MDIKEETTAILKRFDIGNKFSNLPVLPKASVLIPLFVKNGELCTLMTLRSKELRTSAGEVCFPGGKRDPSDRDDVDTALRENGLLVTPVVGFIEESFCPCPNPAEVSTVFTVPLDFFTSKKDHFAAHGAAGMVGLLHSFYFVDPDSGSQYHIWGLTAMLAILVAALALRKKPAILKLKLHRTDTTELLENVK
uniref:Nudix (nucleoside diphosphate linked moiety X)-type motif 7 n=1 Tax=Lates calcarifer TaxID=8187 RepID=A0A4W6DSF2_LATCA